MMNGATLVMIYNRYIASLIIFKNIRDQKIRIRINWKGQKEL